MLLEYIKAEYLNVIVCPYLLNQFFLSYHPIPSFCQYFPYVPFFVDSTENLLVPYFISAPAQHSSVASLLKNFDSLLFHFFLLCFFFNAYGSLPYSVIVQTFFLRNFFCILRSMLHRNGDLVSTAPKFLEIVSFMFGY